MSYNWRRFNTSATDFFFIQGYVTPDDCEQGHVGKLSEPSDSAMDADHVYLVPLQFVDNCGSSLLDKLSRHIPTAPPSTNHSPKTMLLGGGLKVFQKCNLR